MPAIPKMPPKKTKEPELPIINAHAHIFTSDYVPPHLAKTFVPEPFHRLANVSFLFLVVNWWHNSPYSPYKWPYQRWHILWSNALYHAKIATKRYYLLGLLKFAIGVIIVASIIHEYAKYFHPDIRKSEHWLGKSITSILDLMENLGILIITQSWMLKGFLLILFLTFFPSGRNLLFFILTKTSRFFKMLPGKQTMDLARRYMNIAKLSRYKDQFRIFSRLLGQYPPGSAAVVLPMDMEFMEAGEPLSTYAKQMEDLAAIKKKHADYIYPFIFVDPRRKAVASETFFDYEWTNNRVVMKPCFIKTYLEKHSFSGFKIYPALGYYPFDEQLLPLWKYAADHGLPIMTHCIRGTIFYRGKKKQEWDTHPIFEQYEGDQNDEPYKARFFKPLLFQQMNPVDVQEIFTHPMNYACLLKREWLAKLVALAKDERIREIFGYDAATGTISSGLEHLKICFAHFGGDDEWASYLERDRDNWAHQVQQYPDRGIDFLLNSDKKQDRSKPEKLWKYADWYSLICSLMLQHPNVYADISYILHSELQILPLLKQTLMHPKLRERVLFGTDYYVVRNHKSDKQMLAEMRSGLSEEDFDQIARINPRSYLNLSMPGADAAKALVNETHQKVR